MPAYRYEFSETISFEDALETLTLSRIAVASAVGESRARLELEQHIDPGERAIELGADSHSGAMLNRVFTGYLAREFPQGSFKVATIRHQAAAAMSARIGEMDA